LEERVNDMKFEDCPHYYREPFERNPREYIDLCRAKKPKQRDLERFSEQVAKVITCKCEKRGCQMGNQIDWDE